MFQFFKRLFTRIIARFKQQPTLEPASKPHPKRRAARPVSSTTAANYVGIPFDRPWKQTLPEGYFWKQDEGAINAPLHVHGAKPLSWRIYRRQISSNYYH